MLSNNSISSDIKHKTKLHLEYIAVEYLHQLLAFFQNSDNDHSSFGSGAATFFLFGCGCLVKE